MGKKALLSVSDKRGIVEFAKELVSLGFEILSTGGTAKTLRDSGVSVTEVSDYTGFPEMLDGRLKTLHPKIHGGLLARRGNQKDMDDLKKHDISPIDIVVVNLYPFEETVSKPNVSFEEAIENIDIGGPTMLRAASKNFQDVAVIVDPDDYQKIIDEIRSSNGSLSRQTRLYLAQKVFSHTARYDALISEYLRGVTKMDSEFPDFFTASLKKVSTLRYGENPQQKAAIYKERSNLLSLPQAEVLQGKEMSFNNYLDTHSALMLVLEFEEKACAIIKHNNPCGVAIADTLKEAFIKAEKADPISAFGGVVAFNEVVDADTAKEMVNIFLEVIIAPSFSKDALEILSKKPNVRLLQLPEISRFRGRGSKEKIVGGWDIKRIAGGLLLQEWDFSDEDIMSLKAVTKRQPTDEERQALSFAWKVCKHVKSNAIVYAFKDRTAGIGIGQTKRVYSAKIGAMNATEPIKGAVAASDGFFPFRDGIDVLAEMGVTAVVQPGGSLKDQEVIQAADEHGMAMIITGVRHFRH